MSVKKKLVFAVVKKQRSSSEKSYFEHIIAPFTHIMLSQIELISITYKKDRTLNGYGLIMLTII